MAGRNWTPAQRQAIETRGGTALVSAAAGSGKTAVLVERLLSRLTDPDHPVDIDRVLVVTFTKAAAAEMRSRLGAALSERIAADPHNLRLQRQQLLLPGAAISTIHGFCATLLKEQSHLLDVSPDFQVAETAQANLLQADAMTEVLEEQYAARSEDFQALASLLSSGRSDAGLAAAVKKVYEFIQSHPFPEAWLLSQERVYDGVLPAADTLWGQQVLAFAADALQAAVSLLQKAAALAGEEELMAAAYRPALQEDLAILERAAARLPHCSWDEAAALVTQIQFTRLGALRQYPDPGRQERVKALRAGARGRVEGLQKLFFRSEADCAEDIAACRPLVRALCATVRLFADRYQAKKRARRLLDFDDLEHLALSLLLQSAEGSENGEKRGAADGGKAADSLAGWVRTPLARELSQRFEEILVDEYQDTNAAQDALFEALSRDGTNLFLVGDVKQSIYGFRRAMPELFLRRRDSYPPYDGTHFPAAITLGHNFRSRREVTDSVNFVFRQLMTAAVGGIDYTDGEELVCAANYPEAAAGGAPDGRSPFATQLLVVDTAGVKKSDGGDEAEARLIAGEIRRYMEQTPVSGPDGPRPAQYRDFCILLRSKTAHAAAYVDELNAQGIPAFSSASGGFFEASEVALAVSLLRFIDNPLQDVPLLAVLLSPLFGFTPDDLGDIRLCDRQGGLYTAVRRMSRTDSPLGARCREFLRQMEGYRTLAATLPADRLLHRLYGDTGLLAAVSAMPHGAQRAANLRLLHAHARRFEQDGFRGLSAFVRFLDRLSQQDVDMAPAALLGEHADVVRVMSIHHSKGLEFPVVFLGGLSTAFNRQSLQGPVLLHADLGVGFLRLNEEMLTQNNTLPRQGISLAIERAERTEELRVLYVAMTRAREKLCLLVTLPKPTPVLTQLAAGLDNRATLPAYTLLSAKSLGEWLLLCALRHPSGTALRKLADAEDLPLLPADEAWDIRVVSPPEAAVAESEEKADVCKDDKLYNLIQERIAYQYPYAALQGVPNKMAASGISHKGYQRDLVATARPAFLGHTGLTPAQRGTALHTFMQFADYAGAARDPEAERRRLVEYGYLTEQQAEAVELPKLRAFFGSELYGRMARSPRCLRELPFTIERPASAFWPALRGTPGAKETLVIQGIADCVFEEDGALVIVDYKTDRVGTGQELIDRYAGQLRIYRSALSETLRMPVRQCLLYAFGLGRVVEIPQEETDGLENS